MAIRPHSKILADLLDSMTCEGELYEKLPDGKARCFACAHRCVIFPGKRGICQVRFNRDGKLYVPWGYVSSLQCDPIEKKPFYHVLPGGRAMTFGMLGCDFRCIFCQNWITSEWAVEIFKRAKREGLLTGYVSNGNATPEVLDYLRPHLDCYKVDLKTMQDKNYR